jgi:hypothetical protein
MTRRGARFLGGLLLSTGLVALSGSGPAQESSGKVMLKDVSYDDLGKFVRAQAGKVVVVDFWADF